MATDFDAHLKYRQHYELWPFWRIEMSVQFNRKIKRSANAIRTQNHPLWLNFLKRGSPTPCSSLTLKRYRSGTRHNTDRLDIKQPLHTTHVNSSLLASAS